MTWWQRLAAWLSPAPPDRLMTREGRELRWDRAHLPVSLYVDASALGWWDALVAASIELQASARRRMVLYPEEPIAIIRESFLAGPVSGVSRAIYVLGDPAVPTSHGDTDVRFDQRTGEIRNVLMRLPARPPDYAVAMAVHEMGHAFGLDHEAGGIMAPRLWGGEEPRFGRDAERLLQRTYG